MKFLEKSLEDIIFESDNKSLESRGLDISGKKYRQVKIGNYGVADLITFERPSYMIKKEDGGGWHYETTINIYELKQHKVNMHTVLQAIRYSVGLCEYLKMRGFVNYELYHTVIGREVDTQSDFIYLPDFMPNLRVLTYDYKLDGIYFKEHSGYKLTNNGF